MKNKLIIGRYYKIRAREYDVEGVRTNAIRMKLVGLYRHLAVFERPAGYCESFTYWELEKVIVE